MLSPNKSLPMSWSEQAFQRFRELADQPVFLVFVLLAANAVTRPYANVAHDTRLYSVQVLNQTLDGAYNSDLFFRYGSQDQYSLFSLFMAPLARLVGLATALFLAYLVSTTIFIIGLVWLVGRLLDDGLLRLVSLIYLVIAPLNYGGLYTLHVHEAFTTPRLLAVGLVLLGLAQLVGQAFEPDSQARKPDLRAYLLSLFLTILAGLVHPLMATGGFLIWAGVLLVDKLGWKYAAGVTAILCIAGAVFLATPSVAGQVLGVMDDEWRHAILNASAFNFTSEWEIRDWGNVFFSGVGVLAGVCLYWKQDPGRVRFIAVAGLVGVAAVAGTVLAEHLPYALLLQGQPYRALWILKVLQVPLCFLLADRLLRTQQIGPQLLAFVPLGFLLNSGPTSLWFLEWRMALLFFPGCVVVFRGLDSQPNRPDWLVRSVACSLLTGELAWCIFREVTFVQGWNILVEYTDLFDRIQALLMNVGIIPWMLLILGSTLWLISWQHVSNVLLARWKRAATFACVAFWLGVQTTFFVLPNTSYVREHGSKNLPDIEFARDFLRGQPATAKLPTVYSAYGKVEYVWLELGTNSYFDWWQTGGFMFRRQTAIEGQRRALVVGPFEVERFRNMEMFLDDRIKRNVAEFFQLGMDTPGPTVKDLERLCQEPELDYLVLKDEFPNLYSATNGRVYVYDCRQVRAKLFQ